MNEERILRAPVFLFAAFLLAAVAAAPQARPNGGDPYTAYKRTFEKWFDQGKIAVEVQRDSGAVDLTDCGYGSSHLESDSSRELTGESRRLADLAYEVVRLGRLLRKLGYPEAVWRPRLVELEKNGRAGFSRAAGGYLEKLSETVNAYRRSSARALPTTVVEGCGEDS